MGKFHIFAKDKPKKESTPSIREVARQIMEEHAPTLERLDDALLHTDELAPEWFGTNEASMPELIETLPVPSPSIEYVDRIVEKEVQKIVHYMPDMTDYDAQLDNLKTSMCNDYETLNKRASDTEATIQNIINSVNYMNNDVQNCMQNLENKLMEEIKNVEKRNRRLNVILYVISAVVGLVTLHFIK